MKKKLPYDPEEAKLRNIVDMGLAFSGMIRLFEKGMKGKLFNEVIKYVKKVFEVESPKDFNNIHSDFCNWGVCRIKLAKGKTDGTSVSGDDIPSYGQIAKTFNVVLKVVIYYSHLPEYEKAENLSKWLHAAVDTKMMRMLKSCYPDFNGKPWPSTLHKVKDIADYNQIQEIVDTFIKEKHDSCIIPLQFDDIYWRELNRK